MTEKTADPFVLIEHGIVTNHTALPVLDITEMMDAIENYDAEALLGYLKTILSVPGMDAAVNALIRPSLRNNTEIVTYLLYTIRSAPGTLAQRQDWATAARATVTVSAGRTYKHEREMELDAWVDELTTEVESTDEAPAEKTPKNAHRLTAGTTHHTLVVSTDGTMITDLHESPAGLTVRTFRCVGASNAHDWIESWTDTLVEQQATDELDKAEPFGSTWPCTGMHTVPTRHTSR